MTWARVYLYDELHVLRVRRDRLLDVYGPVLVPPGVQELPLDEVERGVVVAAALVRWVADLLGVRVWGVGARVEAGVGVRVGVRARVRVGVRARVRVGVRARVRVGERP